MTPCGACGKCFDFVLKEAELYNYRLIKILDYLQKLSIKLESFFNDILLAECPRIGF